MSILEELNWRFVFRLVIVIVFLAGGLGYAFSARYQTAYSFDEPFQVCEGPCIVSYRIIVGNTGHRTQPQLTLVFTPEVKESIEGEIGVFLTGIRRTDSSWDEDRAELSFGPLEPSKWVAIKFMLKTQTRDDYPQGDELLQRIVPAQGQVFYGHPSFIRFGRFLRSLFDLFG